MPNEIQEVEKQSLIKQPKFKFIFWTIIFLLFVLWIGSWWLLVFVPVIYDFYVSKKVNWTFWKKRNLEKKSKLVEWIDAIVFAVIAATIIRSFFIEAFTIPTPSMEKDLLVGDYLFVSKFNYGPRMPITPLSFPFAHHTLPGTKFTKSYLEWIVAPYKRLAGLEIVENDDVVVFNFPAGDTVVAQKQEQSYYSIVDQNAEHLRENDRVIGKPLKTKKEYTDIARKAVKDNYDILVRPLDKRENYIKRCVAIPGNTLEVKNSDVYIDGKLQKDLEGKQYNYIVTTKGRAIFPDKLKEIGLSNKDIESAQISPNEFIYPLTKEMVGKIKKMTNVAAVVQQIEPVGKYSSHIFPHNENYKWNVDNFGPLHLPKQGETIKLDTLILPLYLRCIETYEGNKVEVKGAQIFINDKLVTEYTFKQGYYFMMGDNRNNSADSRFWGFVPEDHIVGKGLFIWWSIDEDKGFFGGGLRWRRIMNFID